MSDDQVVELTLKVLRDITRGLRHGGYGQVYALSLVALERWAEIKKRVEGEHG